MIIEYRETVKSDFQGTIIDVETIGEFVRTYRNSRRYKAIQLVIFGFVNRNALQIFCAEGEGSINELKEEASKIISGLERPFYAFNSEFERGVLFHNLGMKIDFAGELQRYKFEPKVEVVRELGIPNYDDPFFDNGRLCTDAWRKREFNRAIAHNRACLLKERDILSKRGFRDPDELYFVEGGEYGCKTSGN